MDLPFGDEFLLCVSLAKRWGQTIDQIADLSPEEFELLARHTEELLESNPQTSSRPGQVKIT